MNSEAFDDRLREIGFELTGRVDEQRGALELRNLKHRDEVTLLSAVYTRLPLDQLRRHLCCEFCSRTARGSIPLSRDRVSAACGGCMLTIIDLRRALGEIA